MLKAPRPSQFILLAVVIIVVSAGCGSIDGKVAPGSFASARPVLESNCVHCHGTNRLAGMPPFADTQELGRLVGSNNWIVPGHPERSRFLTVVKLADEQPGAMPPTGHAISKSEIEALRDWIAVGAPLPKGAPVMLVPQGQGPRDR